MTADAPVLPALVVTVECPHCPRPFDLAFDCDPEVYATRGLIPALDERDAALGRALWVHHRQHGVAVIEGGA